MIVSLAALKLALGIATDDASEDASLTQMEALAASFVEEQTERRWQVPAATKEYQVGSGTRVLFLSGHVESVEADAVTVRERVPRGEWEAFTDFDVRRDTLVRTDGEFWNRNVEYEITYDDGWTTAPGDIQALVIDLVGVSRSLATGEAGLKSETIGDYSYSLDTSFAAASISMTDVSTATMNRRRRRHI